MKYDPMTPVGRQIRVMLGERLREVVKPFMHRHLTKVVLAAFAEAATAEFKKQCLWYEVDPAGWQVVVLFPDEAMRTGRATPALASPEEPAKLYLLVDDT